MAASISHGCVIARCESVLQERTQRRAPFEEAYSNTEKINIKQENGLSKQKSFSDLKIIY
jgi:hypothetical protein